MGQVLVLADRDEDEGTVRRSTLALLTLARRLGAPVAVLCGPAPDAGTVQTLRDHGARRIRYADPLAAAGSCADVLTAVAVEDPAAPPVAILIATGYPGQETAGRVAVRLGTGIIADAVDVRPGPDGRPVAVQSCLAGSYLVESDVPHGIPIITVRAGAVVPVPVGAGGPPPGWRPGTGSVAGPDGGPGAGPGVGPGVGPAGGAGPSNPAAAPPPDRRADAAEGGGDGDQDAPLPAPHPAPVPEPIALPASAVSPIRRPVVIRAATAPRDPSPPLESADIVVAGGRGVGSASGFTALTALASALGAAVGATHTATELGWCPRDRRIGLTGATIRPRLYVAVGVSGSVRHRAGMQAAKTVVAICDDPGAPIFRVADIGVVGDLHLVLPALLAELAARRIRGPEPPEPPHHPSTDLTEA